LLSCLENVDLVGMMMVLEGKRAIMYHIYNTFGEGSILLSLIN
jgi:hypothetical protein